MREQPVPAVSRADVERIVRRDFPAATFAEVMSLLDGNETDPSPRVQLAVLKLASGNLGRLRKYNEDAKMDYRDVLAWAEYPGYLRKVPGPGQPPGTGRIIEDDWEQYRAWLERV